MCNRLTIFIIISTLIITVFSGLLLIRSNVVSALPSHAPISIDGNASFNASNGVSGGNGTQTDPFIIEGYDINAGSASGVLIQNTNAHFIIRDMYIHSGRASFNDGIALYNVTNGTIKYCEIVNNYDGIELGDSTKIVITSNNVSNSYRGIALASTSIYNNITYNNLTGNTFAGIALFTVNYNNLIGNNATGSQFCIYLSSSHYNNLTGNSAWSGTHSNIYLTSSTENNLSFNKVWTNIYYGIHLAGSTNNHVLNNTVWDTAYGIYVFSSSNNNEVRGNNLTDNWAGINLRFSGSCTVQENEVYRNSQYGIYTLGTSNGNNISYNYLTYNGYGIHSESSSDNNEIYDNDLVNNFGGVTFLESSRGNVIINNEIAGNEQGILLRSSDNNYIKGNLLLSNEKGIILEGTDNNNIIDNNIQQSNGTGIHIYDATYETLINNKMVDNGILIEGEGLNRWVTHTIPASNEVNFEPVIYWKNTNGGTIPAGAGQVILANCNYVTVEGLDLSDGSCGIELGESRYCTVKGNTASRNTDYGIYLSYSEENEIIDNWVHTNGQSGIKIDTNSRNNKLEDNHIFVNKNGLDIIESYSNDIINNSITGNSESGINMYLSDETWIFNNTIGVNLNGFFLDNSHSNKIVENTIMQNENGFYLTNSDHNKMYHNYIYDNINQSIDVFGTNYWNDSYSTCGNFWSDYTGYDNKNGVDQNIEGSDGIGDSHYIIDYDSRDFYPLMKQYNNKLPSVPGKMNATGGDKFVYIKWEPPKDTGGYPVMGYNIYRRSMPGMSSLYAELGNQTYYNDTNVFYDIIYSYEISALTIIGEGPLSESVHASPEEIPEPISVPDAPWNLIAVSGDNFINLSWVPPTFDGGTPVINYSIYRGVSSDDVFKIAEIGNVTWFNDTNFKKGITYYYKVSASNAVGEGPKSDSASSVVITIPDAPINLTASAGDEYVFISWEEPPSDGGLTITKYNIYRRTKTSEKYIFLRYRTSLNFNDTGLPNDIAYYYAVTAVNSLGESPYSEEAFATPTLINEPPEMSISFNVTSGPAPLTVSFSASAEDSDGLVVSYNWDFGDSTTSSEKDPIHTFKTPGEYTVTLTVMDNDGDAVTAQVNITVLPPGVDPPDNGKPPITNGNDSDDDEKDDKGLSTTQIAGISAAVIIVIILVVLFFFQMFRRKRTEEEYQQPPEHPEFIRPEPSERPMPPPPPDEELPPPPPPPPQLPEQGGKLEVRGEEE